MAQRSYDQRFQGAGQLRHKQFEFLSLTRALSIHALALACACLALTPADAARKRSKPKAKPAPAQVKPAPEPAKPEPPVAPPSIPLQRNMRFVVRPTLLGLLPPPDPLNFGEAFVRVLEAGPQSLTLRYEIKEQLDQDKQTKALYLLGSAPLGAKIEPLTRIKRGDITVSRSAATAGLSAPMFWADGNWAATDGLLWLPAGALESLKAGAEVPWAVALPTAVPMAEQLPGILAGRRLAVGANDSTPVTLRLLDTPPYRCRVNGAAVDLPSVRAVDSLLLAEYYFLDDPDNPLLLKLNYLPLQEADPASAGWAALINAGGGCAITQIDF